MDRSLLPVLATTLLSAPALAGGGTFGGVFFPDGEASFADQVIAYDSSFGGGPAPTHPNFLDPDEALGIPDYTGGSTGTGAVSLGHGGLVELRFIDNVLTNSGNADADLWIFEVGPDVEDTFVAVRPKDPATAAIVSAVGTDVNFDGFYEVGKVFGSTASVDLDAFFPGHAAGSLRFDAVQLVDDPAEGNQSGQTVGGDIDAVGAITSSAACDPMLASLNVPIAADVDYGDLVVAQGIGSISVTKAGGSGILGDFVFAPGFESLDNCYDFRWINVLVTEIGPGGSPESEDDVVGLLPAIDPAPSDGPEPFYYNDAEWTSGNFGGTTIRVEGQKSVFVDSRSDPDLLSITFHTFLVAHDLTVGGLAPTQACVLGGFAWRWETPGSVVLCGPLNPDAGLVNAALANGLIPGHIGFPGYPGWVAVEDCALFHCPLLSADVDDVSVASGGAQTFALDAGLAQAGRVHLLLGSTSGTAPGIPLGPFVLPLNAPDAWFDHTLANPNGPFLPGSLQVLDGNGHSSAQLVLPPLSPALAGTVAHHAYVVFGPPGPFALASNAVSVTLVP